MKTRLSPILVKECKTLGWKIHEGSPRTTLIQLLDSIENLCQKIKSNSLNPEEHIKTKEKLKSATREIGVGIPGCALLKKALSEKWAKEKEAQLKKKSEVQLLRELIKLAQNEPKLRQKSQQFQEAWPEIESRYFAKMSLYQAELSQRQNQK